MKLNGIVGTGTGKLGSSVFAVNSGVQIVRQYQPVVSNPSTDKQVEQRAKLKLMSQIAASLASAIAIPKDGLVSARNKFISKNFALTSYASNTASVEILDLQITNGHGVVGGVYGDLTDESSLTYHKGVGVIPSSNDIDKVVIITAGADNNGNLSVYGSYVLDTEGAGVMVVADMQDDPVNTSQITFDKYYAFVYGIKMADAAAKAKFADYGVTTASDIAKLVASRSILESDYTFTETDAVEITYPARTA